MGRHENDGQARLGGMQPAHQLHAVLARQLEVRDDDVEATPLRHPQAVVTTGDHQHVVTFFRKNSAQLRSSAGVVFDQQDSRRGTHADADTGNRTPKVVP